MTAPQLISQIAFEDPTNASPVFVDMTGRVRLAKGFRVQRGRTTELERFMPGRAVCHLGNRDLELDPNNTASAHYPNVVPERRIRHGLALNLLTENQSSLETNTAGWQVLGQCTLARTTAQALHGSASLEMTSTSTLSMAAITSFGTSGVPIIEGTSCTAVMSFRAATVSRACHVSIRFYDAAGTLLSSQAGDPINNSTTGWVQVFRTSTVPVGTKYAAVVASVGSPGGAGEVHYVDKIGLFYGTDDSDWCLGNPDGAGPMWAFRGYVDGFRNEYPLGGDIVTLVSATDIFKPLAHHPLISPWEEYIREEINPTTWLRLGETVTTVARDASGNNNDGTYKGGLVDHTTSGIVAADADKAILFPAGEDAPHLEWNKASRITTAVDFTALALVKYSSLSGAGTFTWPLFYQGDRDDGSLVDEWYLRVTTDPATAIIALNGRIRYSTSGTIDVNVNGNVSADKVHLMAMTRFYDGANTKVTVFLDGAELGSAMTAGDLAPRDLGLPLTTGRVAASGTPDRAVTIDEPMLLKGTVLTAAQMQTMTTLANAPWKGDTSGTRLGRILDQMAVPAAERDVDNGSSTLLSPDIFGGQRALEHAQIVERSEQGPLYATRDGRVRLVSRHNYWSEAVFTTSQATFSNDGAAGSVPYTALRLDPSDFTIRNVVRGQRRDGPTYLAQDATSKARFFPRDLDRTSLELELDVEVSGMVDAALARYKDPVEVIRTLRVRPSTLAQWRTILALDLGYRVTVAHTPEGAGYTITQESHLEGIEISNEDGVWEVNLSMSPVGTEDYWVLGTSALGTETRLGW